MRRIATAWIAATLLFATHTARGDGPDRAPAVDSDDLLSEGAPAKAAEGGEATPRAKSSNPSPGIDNAGDDLIDPIHAKEQNSPSVDEAALLVKKRAILTLQSLAKQRQNTREEPDLLVRLAEANQDAAEIEYRVAHVKAQAKNAAVDLREYHGLLKDMASPLTRLLSKHPRDASVPRALYLRAKAERELGEINASIDDLKACVERYPNSRDYIFASHMLWDMLIEQKNYRAAVAYLTRFNTKPGDRFFNGVMDRLARVHYYLNDIGTAMKYIDAQVDSFSRYPAGDKAIEIDREKAYSNAALFYCTAIEHKLPGYDVAGALEYFKKIKTGNDLGKTMVSFGYFLRAKGLDADIEAAKALVVGSSEVADLDKVDFLLLTFENQMNKQRYAPAKDTCAEMVALLDKLDDSKIDPKRGAKIQKSLGEASVMLQKAFLANKNSSYGTTIASTLYSVYGYLLRVSNDKLETQIQLRFNMGEIAFHLKQYESAIPHYRWIVAKGPSPKQQSKLGELVGQAWQQSISARFESLRASGVIPKVLSPQPIESAKQSELTTAVSDFVAWVDHYPEDAKSSGALDVYRFEANRLLYSLGFTKTSISRILKYLKRYPDSKYAIPQATLVVDTFVASQKWEETLKISADFLKVAQFKGTPFYAQLGEVAGGAAYKLVEAVYNGKDYNGALKQVEAFLKSYPQSKYRNAAFALAANAALALGKKAQAAGYFAELKRGGGLTAELVPTALLTNAALAEESYDFAQAARTYVEYVGARAKIKDDSSLNDIRRRALLLAWISADAAALKQVLANAGVCTPLVEEECQQYEALGLLSDPRSKSDAKVTRQALDKIRQAREGRRAPWVAVALENARSLSYRDHFVMLDVVAADWDRQEPLVKYALLPYLSDSIPESLKSARSGIKYYFPVKLDKVAMQKRTKMMEEMEEHIDKIAALPWARLRALALQEQAGLYQDLSKDISGIAAPPGTAGEAIETFKNLLAEIRGPFDKKREELRKKAFELATEQSIDDDARELIVASFMAESSVSQAQPIHGVRAAQVGPMTLALLEDLAERGPWTTGTTNRSEDEAKLAQFHLHFAAALEKRNWPMVAYLLQEGKGKKLLEGPVAEAAQAVALSLAHARSEALSVLSAAMPAMSSKQRLRALTTLIGSHYASSQKAKTKQEVQEFADIGVSSSKAPWLTETDAKVLTQAAQWAEAQVSKSFGQDLESLARENERLRQVNARTPARSLREPVLKGTVK